MKKPNRLKYIGARIFFNGNEDDFQTFVDRYGRPLHRVDLISLTHMEMKWTLVVHRVHAVNGHGHERIVEREDVVIDTPCKFNDLNEIALSWRTEAMLGMPDGYKFKCTTWCAKVVG